MVNIPVFRQTFQLKVGIGLTYLPDYYSMKEKTNTTFPQTKLGNLGFSINEMADHSSMKQKEKTNETIPLEMENGLTNIPDSNGMKQKDIRSLIVDHKHDIIDWLQALDCDKGMSCE